jgi:hypothetical protein
MRRCVDRAQVCGLDEPVTDEIDGAFFRIYNVTKSVIRVFADQAQGIQRWLFRVREISDTGVVRELTSAQTFWKYEKGAMLLTPSLLIVVTSAIGRGTVVEIINL